MTVKNPKTSLRTLFGLAVVACFSAQTGLAQTKTAPKPQPELAAFEAKGHLRPQMVIH